MPGGTEVHTSLAAIDGAEWDAIVPPRRLFQRYDFQRALQEATINDCEYRWFIARDAHGRMAAHAAFYSISTPLDLFLPGGSRLGRFVGGVRAMHPAFLQCRLVECGSPTALGHPIAFRPDLPAVARAGVLAGLTASMEAFAEEKNAQLLVLRDFRDGELAEMEGLADAGFRAVPNLDDSSLRLAWSSFDDYVASLRSHYRRQIRLNQARADRAGLRAERVIDIAPHAEELARLWTLTHRRSKEYQRERLGADYFRAIARNLEGRAFATLFRIGERIVGFTLYLANDDVLVPSYIGIDYEANSRAAVVFNAYYDWIRTGIDMGFAAIELGITTYEPKRRLGAKLERLHVLIRHRRPALTPMVAALYRLMTPRQTVPGRHVFAAQPAG